MTSLKALNARRLLLAAVLASLCGGCPSPDRAPTRTIRGRAIEPGGEPARFIQVSASGDRGWLPAVFVEADGRFTLEGVPPTYDLLVIDSLGVGVFVGLTRSDPTVTWPARSAAPFPAANANATATADGDCGGPCPPPGRSGSFAWAFDQHSLTSTVTSAALPHAAYAYAAVAGPAPVIGRLHALYWTWEDACGPDCAQVSYQYARSDPFALRAGDSLQLPPLALAPVPSRSFHVEVRPPSGFTGSDPLAYVTAHFGAATLTGPTFVRPVAAAGIDVALPDLPEQATTVAAWGFNGPDLESFHANETLVPAGAPGATVALHPAPALLEPSAGAAFGPGTRFSWTPSGGFYEFQLGHSSGDTYLRIFTKSSQIALPDLSALRGFPYLPGTTMVWRVVAFAGPSTADDLVGPPGPPAALERSSGWSSLSALRQATVR